MSRAIQKQVRLPISVAFGVVMQGIRIRLGRAIVTLMGVVLGIAFLMSILTGQTIRLGVSQETEARVETRRMVSFLSAEIGPVEGRVLGVVATGPLNEQELRLLTELHARRVARLQWAGPVPAGLPAGLVQPVEGAAVGREAAAVIQMGEGPNPGAAAWREWLGKTDGRVVAATRRSHGVPAVEGVLSVCLEREWRPDEVTEKALQAQRARFRTGWIIAISMMVTVIGICNAMLMSVTERFREIGTMKCLGALSQFVRQVFFLEASMMGLVGSLAGCVFGVVFAGVAYSMSYGIGMVLGTLDTGTLLLHSGFCLVAGMVLSVVAAIYPAGVASRMMPAAALRSTV